MSKRSYSIIGVLTLVAVACLAATLPQQMELARAAATSGTIPSTPVSPLALLGGLVGTVAWVWALVAMARAREFGWALASVVLSYLAVAAWVVRGLATRRPQVA